MSNQPIDVRVGDRVAGFEVLAIEEGLVRRDRVYHVRHDCCGARGTISHSGLTRRLKVGLRVCKACGLRGRAKRAPVKPSAGRVALDRAGYPWPRLGPMGPRWAMFEPNWRPSKGARHA